MPERLTKGFILAAALSVAGTLGLGFLTPAWAEGRCPPGFHPTGGNDAGWLGCAPMGPIDDASPEADDDAAASSMAPSRYDPQQWEEWMRIIREGESAAEAERLKDPIYRDLKQGIWEFGKDGTAPDQLCSAFFLTLRGGVVLMDWAGNNPGTFIAFYGGGIEPAPSISTVRVSLRQSGETQNVNAFHGPFPWARDISMIMFAVPSTEALIASIEDVQDFELAIAGRHQISGAWHGGLQARNHLRDCVDRRVNR